MFLSPTLSLIVNEMDLVKCGVLRDESKTTDLVFFLVHL